MNAPGYELPFTDLRLGFNRKNHGYLEFAFIVSSNGLEANLRISAFANGWEKQGTYLVDSITSIS